MNGKFVKIIGNKMIADYTAHKKHFKYLTPTPEEETALVAEAKKWAVYHIEETKVSHDEFGDYNIDTKHHTTRLDDYHGDIIIKDGRVWGVVSEYRLIKRGETLVEKSDSWESRAVYYYTDRYTIVKAEDK